MKKRLKTYNFIDLEASLGKSQCMVWELERHVKKVGFGNYGEDFPEVWVALYREVKESSLLTVVSSAKNKSSLGFVLLSGPRRTLFYHKCAKPVI